MGVSLPCIPIVKSFGAQLEKLPPKEKNLATS